MKAECRKAAYLRFTAQKIKNRIINAEHASMAELADAIDLGSIGNPVQVRSLLLAPYFQGFLNVILLKMAFKSSFFMSKRNSNLKKLGVSWE